MTGRLAGKVALVTGAASGIGAATVELMLREGARVLATDIDADRGEALRARLAAQDESRIVFARSDVTQERDWETAIALAAERLGPLDVLVNNAGVIPAIVPLVQTSLDEWRRVMAVNLDAGHVLKGGKENPLLHIDVPLEAAKRVSLRRSLASSGQRFLDIVENEQQLVPQLREVGVG